MQKITPFLWFDGNTNEVVKYYASIFKDTEILSNLDGPGEMFTSATVRINGFEMIIFNGGPMFTFNESFSLFVNCQTQEEVDYYWNKLTADGGQESRCGWLKDKYGLSWQIIPESLGKMMGDPDKEKVQKMTGAMMQMNKLVIADLESAFNS